MKNNVHSFKHEADEKREMADKSYGFSGEHLKQLIQKLERLEKDASDIKEDIREVFGEAKSNGFDIKIIKLILRERKTDRDVQLEQECLLKIYRDALGMTPLEEYAAEKAAEGPQLANINGIECDIQEILKAQHTTDAIIDHLKVMHQMGGFRATSEVDKKLAKHFVDMKLLKQPNKYDDLFMLTARAEKLATK